jgi:3-phenylpropionate/cinnamic acid dioxygenase small subunit
MRAWKLKWKWRARLARYEQEARYAMRAWLMI